MEVRENRINLKIFESALESGGNIHEENMTKAERAKGADLSMGMKGTYRQVENSIPTQLCY